MTSIYAVSLVIDSRHCEKLERYAVVRWLPETRLVQILERLYLIDWCM